MNRIVSLFQNKNERVFNVFFTAGYPTLNDTVGVAKQLEKAGVDMIEIGIPYSDPLADGTTIQQSSDVSLRNGMNLNVLFEQLTKLRQEVSIPVLLMGYFNPVMQYGVERFCQKASEVGVDGVILPDLPIFEYRKNYKTCFEKCNLSNVFLVTPQTSEQRIREIDELSNGFIYLLSSNSTTGGKLAATSELKAYYDRVNSMNLRNPKLIGFGISDKNSFDAACQYANGAIIGSEFIRHLGKEDSVAKIPEWVKGIIG